MKRKGALRPSTFLLLTLAITLIVTTAWLTLADFERAYPEVEINKTWESLYSKARDVSSDVNASAEKIREETATMGEGGWADVIVSGFVMLSVIPLIGKLILTGLTGLLSMIITSLSEIGVPPIIGGTILVAIAILVIFGVISAIWKYEKV